MLIQITTISRIMIKSVLALPIAVAGIKIYSHIAIPSILMTHTIPISKITLTCSQFALLTAIKQNRPITNAVAPKCLQYTGSKYPYSTICENVSGMIK